MNYKLEEMKIEVTHACPLTCVHCSSNSYSGNNLSIEKEKCLCIIKEASDIGLKKLAFSGGEPLLWDGIFDAVAFSKKLGLDVSLYTTGAVDNSEKLFHKLGQLGTDKAIFSLYSHDPVIHNRVTRYIGSFDATLNSIRLSIMNGITPELHFVALSSNYRSLPLMAEFAHKHGIQRISVLRLVPQGRGAMLECELLTHQQCLELREIIESLRTRGFMIRTGSPFNVLQLNADPRCLAAKNQMILTPDLRIYPCDAFKQIEAETIVGQIDYSSLRTHSVEDCWLNSDYLKIIRQTIDMSNSECEGCNFHGQCMSGCLAQKYIYYGTLAPNKDPLCLLEKRAI